MRLFLFLCVCALAFSCRKESAPPPASAPLAEEEPQPILLSVLVDGLQLRASPGPEGKVLMGLKEGEVLTDLMEVSDFTTPVKLRGVEYDEPWIKVRTKQNQEGWVYAGGIGFDLLPGMNTGQVLLEKRLQTFFGGENVNQIQAYASTFHSAADAAQLAEAFLMSRTLRENLNARLEERIQISNTGQLPDLFWLYGAIPGYIPQLVAEGTMYTLFAHYGEWAARAARTAGKEDDDFFALALQFFPEDSVEYFFPAYFIQTWDYGGSSLLGRGIHKQLLSGMDRLYRSKSPFTPELLRMKTALIDDITLAGQSFWEKQEFALRELENILDAKYAMLDKADKAALQARFNQLKTPERFNLKMNQQSGE